MTGTQIATAIGSGELDDQLGVIATAMRSRRQVLEAQKAASLVAGDVVRLKGMRPKYVNGMQGVVEAIEGTKVLVTVAELAGTRFRKTSWLESKNVDAIA